MPSDFIVYVSWHVCLYMRIHNAGCTLPTFLCISYFKTLGGLREKPFSKIAKYPLQPDVCC